MIIRVVQIMYLQHIGEYVHYRIQFAGEAFRVFREAAEYAHSRKHAVVRQLGDLNIFVQLFLVDRITVASPALSEVEHLIDQRKKSVKVLRIRRERSSPHSTGNISRSVFKIHINTQCLRNVIQPFVERTFIRIGCISQIDEQQLISAETTYQSHIVCICSEFFCYRTQHLISRAVSETVVDDLEIIQIQNRKCKRNIFRDQMQYEFHGISAGKYTGQRIQDLIQWNIIDEFIKKGILSKIGNGINNLAAIQGVFSPEYICDIYKTTDQPDDLSVVIQRTLGSHDVAFLSAHHTTALHLIGTLTGQYPEFILLKRFRIGMPAHILIGLTEENIHGIKTVIIQKGLVHTQKTPVFILPEDTVLGCIDDAVKKLRCHIHDVIDNLLGTVPYACAKMFFLY